MHSQTTRAITVKPIFLDEPSSPCDLIPARTRHVRVENAVPPLPLESARYPTPFN
jgi:hypothetical protein